MKLNKPMAAITTLAASNGYIIANWYILSISEKAVFPSLNVVFGATAFVALDLAMVAVVFSEPEKDWLGWFLTVATIATTCAFSGGIAWHLFGDLWHTAFAAAQFMIALHVTHDRKLSHRTRAVRDGVERSLQVAVTERDKMEGSLQVAVTQQREMERQLQVAVTERHELSRQAEQAVTERTEVVTGHADIANELQRVVMERDSISQALHLAQTERDKMTQQMKQAVTERNLAVTSRTELAKELQQVREELIEASHQLEQAGAERDELDHLASQAEIEQHTLGQGASPQAEYEQHDLSEEQKLMIQYIAQNPTATYQEIADVLGVSKTSITRYKQVLSAKQIISRNGTWKVLA